MREKADRGGRKPKRGHLVTARPRPPTTLDRSTPDSSESSELGSRDLPDREVEGLEELHERVRGEMLLGVDKRVRARFPKMSKAALDFLESGEKSGERRAATNAERATTQEEWDYAAWEYLEACDQRTTGDASTPAPRPRTPTMDGDEVQELVWLLVACQSELGKARFSLSRPANTKSALALIDSASDAVSRACSKLAKFVPQPRGYRHLHNDVGERLAKRLRERLRLSKGAAEDIAAEWASAVAKETVTRSSIRGTRRARARTRDKR